MPPEIYDALMPGEDVPKLKRRIGTAFSIPEELINADKVEFKNHMKLCSRRKLCRKKFTLNQVANFLNYILKISYNQKKSIRL